MAEVTLAQAIALYAKTMGITRQEAKEDAERLIQDTMQEMNCSRDFAENSFIEDTCDGMEEQVAELTSKAKENGLDRHQAKSVDAYGKTRTRTRQPNEEKRTIIAEIANFVENSQEIDVDSIETVNIERQIDFKIGNNNYSITLTQHRDHKNKKKSP